MDRPPDHSIHFHLTQLLNQHLLRNFGDCPLQFREPQDLSSKQMKENNQLPASIDHSERVFNSFCRRFASVFMGLFWLTIHLLTFG